MGWTGAGDGQEQQFDTRKTRKDDFRRVVMNHIVRGGKSKTTIARLRFPGLQRYAQTDCGALYSELQKCSKRVGCTRRHTSPAASCSVVKPEFWISPRDGRCRRADSIPPCATWLAVGEFVECSGVVSGTTSCETRNFHHHEYTILVKNKVQDAIRTDEERLPPQVYEPHRPHLAVARKIPQNDRLRRQISFLRVNQKSPTKDAPALGGILDQAVCCTAPES